MRKDTLAFRNENSFIFTNLKTDEGINPYTGKTYSNYECIDPLTGYKIGTVFSDGTLTGLYNNTKEEACAIAQAHNCPNGITIEVLLTF